MTDIRKLIRMLGSDNDAEVLATVRALRRALAANGKDLHWLAEKMPTLRHERSSFQEALDDFNRLVPILDTFLKDKTRVTLKEILLTLKQPTDYVDFGFRRLLSQSMEILGFRRDRKREEGRGQVLGFDIAVGSGRACYMRGVAKMKAMRSITLADAIAREEKEREAQRETLYKAWQAQKRSRKTARPVGV